MSDTTISQLSTANLLLDTDYFVFDRGNKTYNVTVATSKTFFRGSGTSNCVHTALSTPEWRQCYTGNQILKGMQALVFRHS
jgi:hypothetical protein